MQGAARCTSCDPDQLIREHPICAPRHVVSGGQWGTIEYAPRVTVWAPNQISELTTEHVNDWLPHPRGHDTPRTLILPNPTTELQERRANDRLCGAESRLTNHVPPVAILWPMLAMAWPRPPSCLTSYQPTGRERRHACAAGNWYGERHCDPNARIS